MKSLGRQKLLASSAFCAFVGAMLGYGILHPLVMVMSAGMMGDTCIHGHMPLDLEQSFVQSFSLAMLPWSLAFATFGGVLGTLLCRLERTRRDKERLLLQLAATDALTGVANRRMFDDMLSMEWDRSQRHGYHLGMVLIDVDHFKRFNDLNGHQAGDACLQAVAQALQRSLHRPGDFLARYGGEEFVVLAPDTDAAGAAQVAGLMKTAVEDLHLAHGDSPVAENVTISLGIACTDPVRPEDKEELLGAADRALYQAKKEGRNRARGVACDCG